MVVQGFIGVVHVPAMPGDPRYAGGGFSSVEAKALRDAEALVEGGVGGLIVENFGSVPFSKGGEGSRIPPHQIALLALIGSACSRRFRLPVGMNCLRNDARSAMGIAAATGLDFIRVNVHTGACLTDQGIIEGEAWRTLRYRRELEAEGVAILADVMVKHGAPLAPQTIGEQTRDSLDRGLASGVIVTGSGTGEPIDVDDLERAREAAGDAPVFLGSGLTPERAPTLAPLAEGAIVGTWLKEEGDVRRPVDVERVRRMADALASRLRRGPSG